MVITLCLLLMGCGVDAVPSLTDNRVDCPHYGISLIPPKGGVRAGDDTIDTVGQWLVTDKASPPTAKAITSVKVVQLAGRTAEDVVTELARKVGTEPRRSSSAIGGLSTTELSASLPDGRRQRFYIGQVDGRLVVVTVITMKDVVFDAEIAAFVESLEFRRPEPPHLHLHPDQNPMRIAGSSLIFDPCATLCLIERNEEQGITEHGIRNYRENRNELLLTIRTGSRPAGQPLEETLLTYTRSIRDAARIDDADFHLERIKSSPPVFISPLMRFNRGPNGEVIDNERQQLYVLAVPEEGPVVLLQFRMLIDDSTVNGAYAEAAMRVGKTIRSGFDYNQGTKEVQKPKDAGQTSEAGASNAEPRR